LGKNSLNYFLPMQLLAHNNSANFNKHSYCEKENFYPHDDFWNKFLAEN